MRNQSLGADIDVLTTRAFLAGMERRRSRTAEADIYCCCVLASEPITNPRIQVFSQRRPK